MEDKTTETRAFLQDLQMLNSEIEYAEKESNSELIDSLNQKRHQLIMESTKDDREKQLIANAKMREEDDSFGGI